MRLPAKINPRWLRAFFSFGSMHAASMLIPLLAFPWLGRVLKPEHFGLLMWMCLFPPFFTLLVEWGFPLGAARLAARSRGDEEALRLLLGEVVTAKLMLALGGLLASCALLPLLPHASEHPGAFFLAALAGLAKAMSPLWFYQGTGRKLPLLACWDLSFSLLALALVFIFIRRPEQWSLYLLFIGACRLAANTGLTLRLWRRHPFGLMPLGALRLIRSTAPLFLSIFFSGAYHYCFQLVLGYFLAASEMGIIVALDKMLRALVSLLNPFTQTIFPEICVLRHEDPESAWRILRLSLAATFVAASAAAALTWLLAPLAVRVALGSAYPQAPEALRIMIFAAPAAACAQVLGSQILVPFGKDRLQAAICAGVGAASIPLAAALAYFHGLGGAAFTPVCVECALCACYILAALKLEGRKLF